MRFVDYHPISLIVYFSSVIIFTMITMNPVLLLLSFFGAFFSVMKINKKTDFKLYALIFFMICVTNPIFSHNGETVLFFLFDQRFTLEALFYGFAASLLIVGVIYWFKLFSCVFKEDKLTWLIGKISPKLCVVFCMALRFIPLFKENAKNIYNSQISMGVYNEKTLKGKLNLMKDVFSALVSLSVENAIDTADTMHSRGFGNKQRSSFSLLTFTKHDIKFLIITIVFDSIITYFIVKGEGIFYYYPSMRFAGTTFISIFLYIIFAFLCFIPVLNDLTEDFKWKYLISKI